MTVRLLLVTNDFPSAAGGIQRYLAGLLSQLPVDLTVLAPRADGTDPEPNVVRYDGALAPTTRARRWVTAQVQALKPDLLLYGAFPLALLGPSVLAQTGVPYAMLLHGAEVTLPGALPPVRGRYRVALKEASARLAVSQYTRQWVQAHFGVEVTWVGAGVEDEFRPAAGGHAGFVVGTVGRFVRRKGHDQVLRAVARLRSEGIDARAEMVGWGSRERALRRLADRLDVPTSFLIEADQEALIRSYAFMDVFAMPVRSRWGGLEVEGLGLVYLEAAACGVPVIAGRSGGAPETVEEGVTGFVVSKDSELLEALRRLAHDPGLRASMGAAGRRRVTEMFTWTAVSTRVMTALQSAGPIDG